MMLDLVPPRPPDAERQHHQCEDRQQMDRAPRAPEPDFMDEEAVTLTTTMIATQIQPRAVWNSALRRRQLHDAERERRHRREGVNLDDGDLPAAAAQAT